MLTPFTLLDIAFDYAYVVFRYALRHTLFFAMLPLPLIRAICRFHCRRHATLMPRLATLLAADTLLLSDAFLRRLP